MKVSFTDRSDDVKREMERRVRAALIAVGMQAEGDAKLEIESAPRRVDTGLLRNSITFAVSGKSPNISSYQSNNKSERTGESIKPIKGKYSGTIGDSSDMSVYIGTNVEYAVYVHEGARGMTPNRFIRNAIEKNQDRYLSLIERQLKG